MIPEIYIEDVESQPETCDSDDSQDDPSFDILEETQSRLSNLSIKKKSKSRIPVKVGDDVDCIEIVEPVFDANDQKTYEIVQKTIEVGQVEKLKVEQCKLYLRKHGLRLTGKKDILIDRIKEHISIMNGEGEHKYPASSFVMNCKGDACTGDIVMFEQNVYEMFSIVSRSANGPPCGTRIVAGRIVKESYGAAKQQHTFTVEVLWSKGVKPLPPLHPLLIKGRNLYRLKTMRQRWEDESERQKILSEKHARGNAARSNRETRIQEKEKKKALREHRSSKGNIQNEKKQEKKRNTSSPTQLLPMIINSRNPTNLHNNNHHGGSYKENVNCNTLRNQVRRDFNMEFYHHPSRQFERREYDDMRESMGPQSYIFQGGGNNGYIPMGHNQGQRGQFCKYQGQRGQFCKYYAQGRCTYGINCKFLH
ncbi:unnamed protein product [Lactuca virosa]|uniref:C3H1-type domain-containing protein n=1 Tax=Lactuca virosa TaxID=75947 RepID=A0AAU9M4U3_9ASTR|nr:unnamed protein product [Lactuca virosa]